MYTPQPQYSQQAAPVAQPQPSQPTQTGIIWVDGEVGAKAQQLPPGWPANTPMPLWDTNDTIIYLKSTNPMGMPNPLQKLYYRMEDAPQQSGQAFRSAAPALMSGETEGHYVTRDDLEKMKEELSKTISEAMTNKKGGRTNEPAV